MSAVLLILSILLGTVRNLFSKNISDISFGTKRFFLMQSTIFISGGTVLFIINGGISEKISVLTIIYSVIYGLLLLLAQWCYTSALKNGKISICSTVYSLGFILPTISGSLFWNEKITLFDITGIIAVIPAIIISGIKPSEKKLSNNNYIFPLIIAMLSSGGLGIMQKIQQKSAYPEERTGFVITSFMIAGFISLLFYVFSKADEEKTIAKKIFIALGVGFAFGCCNLLNTTLAGMLESAVLFPLLNIGTIMCSIIMGMIFCKEKLSAKDLSVLALGVSSILLINL